MNNMSNKEYYEDEVNLRDYIEVILKYKWLIIGIFFISTIVTAVISLQLPKTYKSDATIEIAQVDEPIYSLNEAKHLIVSEKVLKPVIDKYSNQFDKTPTVDQFRKKIEVQVLKNTHFIDISFKYNNAKLAKEMLENIIEKFFRHASKKYQLEILLQRQHLDLVNEQIHNLNNSLSRFELQAKQLTKKSNKISPEAMSKIILLENLISQNRNNLNEYLNLKLSINKKIKKAKNWQLINSPEVPKHAIAPKKKQMTAIAGVVSLMFAIFLAFFIEFLRTSKPSEKGRR